MKTTLILQFLLLTNLSFLSNVAHAQDLLHESKIIDPVKWNFEIKYIDRKTAELNFIATIEKNSHLLYSYFDPQIDTAPVQCLFINITPTNDFELIDEIIIPEPEEFFVEDVNMKYKWFSTTTVFKQKIKILSNNKFTINGDIEFKYCLGTTCHSPTTIDFSLPINPATIAQKNIEKIEKNEITSDAGGKRQNGSLWLFFLISFLGGLAGTITPCVYPMIPMTVSFFLKNAGKPAKARTQAVFYGISIIFIYTAIGLIISAFLGPNFMNWLSTHWLPNILFFLLFVIFALSFFGMFEIVLPSSLASKTDKQADKGGYVGTFFMALTLVIVSFSCTAPIVGSLLVEAARGDVLKPTVGMFGFSLAFALPFTFLAFSPSWLTKLPKSGGWLNSVKVVLSFLLIALGMKFLIAPDQVYHWNLLSREVYLSFWIVIFTFLGLYLLGKIKLSHDSELPHISIFRLILAIFTFAFVVYLIPGLFGSPLKAISSLLPPQTSQHFNISANNTDITVLTGENFNHALCEKPKYSDFLRLPHNLVGYFDYEQGLACAKKLNKPIFLDFTGHSCANCKRMEAKVWSDPQVLKRLRENFVIISLYVDDRTKLPESEWISSTIDGKVKKTIGAKNTDFQITRFKVSAQPYYVILSPDEKMLAGPYSYDLDINKFIKFLDSPFQNK